MDKLESHLQHHNKEFGSNTLESLFGQSYRAKNHLRMILEQSDNYDELNDRLKFTKRVKVEPNSSTYSRALARLRSYSKMMVFEDLASKMSYLPHSKIISKELAEKMEHERAYNERFMNSSPKSQLGFEFIKEGTKLTKALNKILEKYVMKSDDYDDYDKEQCKIHYQKFCDNYTSKEVDANFYLSLNMYDFMRMSEGNSWRSCHNLDEGEYQAGCMSYALGDFTLLYYEESDSDNTKLVSRCTVQFLENDICFGRIYGNEDTHSEGYELVANELHKLLGGEVEELGYRSNHFGEASGNRAYEDWEYHKHFYYRFTEEINGKDVDAYPLIGHTSYCVECGEEVTDDEEIHCDDCAYKKHECEECGHTHDEDDMYYSERHGWLCDSCSFICEDCGQVHHIDDRHRINGRWSHDDYCDECIGNNAEWCDRCEEWHSTTTYIDHPVFDGNVCDDCIGDVNDEMDEYDDAEDAEE